MYRTIALTTANGNNHLIRSKTNIGGPKQLQQPQQGGLSTGKSDTIKECSYQRKAVDKSNALCPKSLNTNSTNLNTPETETTKVSCRSKPEVRFKDTSSHSSCVVTVFPTTKSNDTQSPPPNNPNLKESHIKHCNTDVKRCGETLIFNQITNSGNNTSHCTTIVKSKSEW